MDWLSIGLAIALGVCVLAALELFRRLRRRNARDVEARVNATVQTLEMRLDELARELSGAVVRAEEETQRSRFLGQIAATLDLDDAIGSTLQAAAGLPDVDAAVVELEPAGDGDERLIGAIGLDRVEGEEDSVRIFSGPPEPRDPRAVGLSYLYEEDHAAGAVHEALGVPLVGRNGRIGWLGVFSRDPDVQFSDADVRRLEDLAERVAPAIENARRFREARQLADLDGLTGLHNRRYFHETLAREVARAHRYNRKAALIVFDLDDFKDVNDRIGHLAGDAVLAEAAERVRDVVRSADIACRVGGDEFAVILPESALPDAQRLYARIQSVVSDRPMGGAGRLRLSAGLAELQSGDDSVAFFERADEALYRAKEAGKGQAVSA
jgi:diguanylate cyclase (GGDEF)-like protein